MNGRVWIFLVGVCGVVMLVAYFSWGQWQRYVRIRSEISVLEAEQQRVQKENSSLGERIQYLSTDSYKEQEAKERLNMRKQDEYVVDIENLRRESVTDQSMQVSHQETKQVTEAVPPYRKWYLKIISPIQL